MSTHRNRSRKALAAKSHNRDGMSLRETNGRIRGSDLGAELAIARGLVDFGLDVLVPDEPDERSTNSRPMPRAQRIWAPDRLCNGKNPGITHEQRDAAHRYLTDYLIGEVGVGQNHDDCVGRRDAWDRLPYNEMRAIRRQSWQRATQAAGQEFSGVLTWVVLQQTPGDRADTPPSVEAWSKSVGWSTERGTGWLRGALSVLANFYRQNRMRSPDS